MDIFGDAFSDYIRGNIKGRITVRTNISDEEKLPVAYFFRSPGQMPPWEKLVLEKCRGRILDVGAGAGSHSIALQAAGMQPLAIDISPGAVEVMKSRGVKNVLCRDFFSYTPEKGFDTILFLMNGAGIAGKLDRVERLLRHASDMLNEGGVIYIESTDLIYLYEEEDGSIRVPMNESYYGEVEYVLGYRGKYSRPFPWLFLDPGNLAGIADDCGLSTEVIYRGEDYNYVAEIKKTGSAEAGSTSDL